MLIVAFSYNPFSDFACLCISLLGGCSEGGQCITVHKARGGAAIIMHKIPCLAVPHKLLYFSEVLTKS